ncbi:MAG: TonB family protein [Bacteroidota bacterium]
MLKYLPGFFALILLVGCKTNYRIPSSIKAKQNPYKEKYTDALDQGSELIKSWYHFTLERTVDSNYVYKQFYPTTRQITDYVSYKTARMKVRHGKIMQWYDNGQKYVEGEFVDGEATGEWRYFSYQNEAAQSYGQLVAGKKEGPWTQLDSLGNIRSTYTYKEDLRDGPYEVFNQQGQVVLKGAYQKGVIADRQQILPAEEKDAAFVIVDVMPYLASCKNKDLEKQKTCSDKTLVEAINDKTNYPRFARAMGVEGDALIQFKVNQAGEVEDIEVLRGVCNEIERSCIRSMEELPKWSPGQYNGQAVNVYFRFSIKFKLA